MQVAITKSLIIKVLAATAIFSVGGFFIYSFTLNKVDQKLKNQQSTKGGSLSMADLQDNFVSLQQEGADNPQTGGLNVSGTVQGSTFTSTVQDGTSPLNVDSQTLVKNLNADMVDGKHAEDLAKTTDNTVATNTTVNNIANNTGTDVSTWTGSTNIANLGTVSQGTWNGADIQDAYIATAANWNTAYSERNQWDGGATGLVAATGRSSLGLGSMSTQASDNVSISGGAITGTTTFNAGTVTSSGAVQGTSFTATGLTQGSVAFAGPGGLISQDNSNLFWDDTNNRLGIGTTAPTAQISQKSTAINESGGLGGEMTDATGWTSTGWIGSYGAGFTHTVGNISTLSRTMTVVSGSRYQISWTMTGRTAGSLMIGLGGATLGGGPSYDATTSGSFGPMALVNGDLILTPTTDFDGTISAVSVKLISAFGSTYNVQDSTGAATIEIRSTLASTNNTFIGANAGMYNTTGISNSAIGSYALANNTTGKDNTAVGYKALFRNDAGVSNTAVGAYALQGNTTGTNNIAIGQNALLSNTTGHRNIAIGVQSLLNNTTGYHNVAIGTHALNDNTTGYQNVANGFMTMFSNTTGYQNVANGVQALFANTTGQSNSANGAAALRNNTTGNYNTANGRDALFSNTTASENTANGHQALYSNTTGWGNVAEGAGALYSNTTADFNTAIGIQALNQNTTGASNAAIGMQALYANTTGWGNTANGAQALSSNTTGTSNTAIGIQALNQNTTGASNAAIGMQALYANMSGWGNVALGHQALFSNQNGTGNTAIGFLAGYSNLGTGNVFLGNQAGYNETGSNKLYVSNSNTATPLIYGDFSTGQLTINGQASATDGIVTKVNAGACSDAIFNTDTNGLMCIDSINGRIYFRYGGAWHYTAQTAGFQIPDYEATGINPGDFLIPYAESVMGDGAIHGMYKKWSDVKTELLGDITSQLNQLPNLSVDNLDVKTASVNTLIVTGDATFKGTLTLENGVKIDTKGPKPACDLSKRGTVWVTQNEGAEVKDMVEVCIKDKGVFVWQALNQ